MNQSIIISEHDAASYIGMSRSFLRQSRMNGTIGRRTQGPPHLKIGRAVRYSIVDLDAWLASHRCLAA